ncbi:MAG: sulfite exporter TauE/SafE family protein, partial [Gammaproteobacteria bacterium]
MLVLGFLIIGMFAGLVAGVFGVGGGVVIIPGLIYLFQTTGLIPEHELMHVALGSSLASVVVTSAIAAIVHARKNNIKWPIAWQLIPGLLLGAIIGSYIATLMDTEWLLSIFAGFLALLS